MNPGFNPASFGAQLQPELEKMGQQFQAQLQPARDIAGAANKFNTNVVNPARQNFQQNVGAPATEIINKGLSKIPAGADVSGTLSSYPGYQPKPLGGGGFPQSTIGGMNKPLGGMPVSRRPPGMAPITPPEEPKGGGADIGRNYYSTPNPNLDTVRSLQNPPRQ